MENKKAYTDKLDKLIMDCKEKVAKLESLYDMGLMSDREVKQKHFDIGSEAWRELVSFCYMGRIDGLDEKDSAYQLLYAAVGIRIEKVPVRIYRGLEHLTGSMYELYGLKNPESLYYDDDPVGKVFKLKWPTELGNETVFLDYFYEVKEVKNEEVAADKKGILKGCKTFDGKGRLRGYEWSEGIIKIEERDDGLHATALSKSYQRFTDPIFKMRSKNPVETYEWIGFYEQIPDDLDYAEGEFYFDATLDPPRGRHYKEQGILAYDDTEEIVILGITEPDVEVVEIPHEINGKPVTALDVRCFENCSESLRKVILPDGLKEIGDNAFSLCEKLVKPEIPDSVIRIGRDIF